MTGETLSLLEALAFRDCKKDLRRRKARPLIRPSSDTAASRTTSDL
jgi:hypothetical protein